MSDAVPALAPVGILPEDIHAAGHVTHHVVAKDDLLDGRPRRMTTRVSDGEDHAVSGLPGHPAILEAVAFDFYSARILQF